MTSFFDTNVLIYIYDIGHPDKHHKARELFAEEASADHVMISTQVLQEFYAAVTSKKIMGEEVAEQAVIRFMQLPVRQIDIPVIQSAMRRNRIDQVSFWDALIIETALSGGADVLWSEDFQHGRIFDGLEVRDPFQ